MKGKLIGSALLSLPFLAAGFVYANAQKPAQENVQTPQVAGYVCPLTGEQLPCQECCPVNCCK